MHGGKSAAFQLVQAERLSREHRKVYFSNQRSASGSWARQKAENDIKEGIGKDALEISKKKEDLGKKRRRGRPPIIQALQPGENSQEARAYKRLGSKPGSKKEGLVMKKGERQQMEKREECAERVHRACRGKGEQQKTLKISISPSLSETQKDREKTKMKAQRKDTSRRPNGGWKKGTKKEERGGHTARNLDRQ